MTFKEELRKTPKDTPKTDNTGYSDLEELHWRIRDEILHREQGKRGGYYQTNDMIAGMSIIRLQSLDTFLTDYRRLKFGDAST